MGDCVWAQSFIGIRVTYDEEEKNDGLAKGTTESLSLNVVDLTTLMPRKVERLWEGRIPKGCLSLLEGDPGLGKSLMTVALAAAISTGRAVVPGEDPLGPPGDVLFLSAEDDIERTILPRLMAAGADLSRVHPVTTVADKKGEERPVSSPDDLDLIEQQVVEKKAVLVVIDPLMAFLSAGNDSHKDADIRRVLHPMQLMAGKTGAAVLILRHLNKAREKSAMYRGGGSIGIIAAARAGFVVARHPEDDEACVLALQKTNLGQQVPSLTYRVIEKEVEVFDKDDNKEVTSIGCLEWLDEVDLSADDILSKPAVQGSSRRESAKDYLQNALAAGPMLPKELEEGAMAEGISTTTLKPARKFLGVEAYESNHQWYAKLPDQQLAGL